MNSSSLYKDFFRPPSAVDKLNLFQLLFEASEINTDIALALLKVIHRELADSQPSDRSAYKRYAKAIETLRYYKTDMLSQIVDVWNKENNIISGDPEWLSHGKIK